MISGWSRRPRPARGPKIAAAGPGNFGPNYGEFRPISGSFRPHFGDFGHARRPSGHLDSTPPAPSGRNLSPRSPGRAPKASAGEHRSERSIMVLEMAHLFPKSPARPPGSPVAGWPGSP